MSDNTKQKTAETVHGSIQYEVVECDSCGSETLEGEVKEFKIGEVEGVACKHCVQEGPVGFPTDELGPLEFVFGAIFWPLVVGVLGDEIDREHHSVMTFFVGSTGGFIWGIGVGILAAVMWL